MATYIKPDKRDPAYQLIIGKPAEIIGATKSPRILLLGLHGNEHLAARVAHYLQTKRLDLLKYVDYICGNPRAAANKPQERYTKNGTDLNRSFASSGNPKSYEEKRAAELIPRLLTYNYVFDLHTTTTTAGDSRRFIFIIHPLGLIARNIIAASPIEHVVIAPGNEGFVSNVIPQTAAFEYNQEYARTPKAIKEIVHTLDVLVGNLKPTPKRREFFYVDSPIPKSQDPGINTPNFKLYKGSYYPILVGDNSYRKDPTKPYVGYAARKKEIIKL